MADDPRNRLDALLKVASRLVTSTPTGQVLMARLAATVEPDWFQWHGGERVLARLEQARTAATVPLDPAAVEAILAAAWRAPASTELDALDSEPVAATPTAQVHRGTLDGAPVAIKVLRPGLSAAVRQDLTLLEGLLAPLAAALPRLDGPGLVREVRERVLDELDLEHEAGLQRRVARALRRHPALIVPAPVTRLCHEQVLVSEWVDGEPLASLPAGAARDAAARRLAGFVVAGIREGIVDAGTDPDDVLVTADGRVAIVDFGAAAAVEGGNADDALALVEAFGAGDGERFGAALGALGLLAPQRGPGALELVAHALGELGGEAPARLDVRALAAAGERLGQRRGAALELLVAGRIAPEQLWPVRALVQLGATLGRIGATAPWREVVARALGDGWDGVD